MILNSCVRQEPSFGIGTPPLTATAFRAPAYITYGALLAKKRYLPAGFKLALGLKDVRLALAAGDATDVSLPFANVLRDRLSDAVARGDGELDLAALGKIAAKTAR
jgi:3-hydroxyisobutyrate dehydrogenase-like beta-hydroxyacid dehydrogenase